MKKALVVLGIIALLAMSSCTEDGAASTATLTVINNSSYIIDEFYCALSSDPSWGANRLDGTISPGGSQAFTIPAGTVDLDAEETTGSSYWDAYDQVATAGGVYEWTLTNGEAVAY